MFYSTLMNDNALDFIISKVKVVQTQPDVVLSNNCCVSSCDKEDINNNTNIDYKSNESVTNFEPQKLELTLLYIFLVWWNVNWIAFWSEVSRCQSIVHKIGRRCK